MLTVQILTKNNQETIQATLESVLSLKPQIRIGDFGSSDDTLDICRKFGAQIKNVSGLSRAAARNQLIEPKSLNLWLQPWESLFGGHGEITSFKGRAAYSMILQGSLISHEIRLWKEGVFINPVFESLKIESGLSSGLQIHSTGQNIDNKEIEQQLVKWKADEPFSAQPYYFQAIYLFSTGQFNEFMRIANQYFFMSKNDTASIMLRYYYAIALMYHKKEVRSTLQNINLCLCQKPLMAEYWCLLGDVYYHLLNRFDHAKEFYENAISLGSRRLKLDRMPMDIDKYHKYPSKMISNCDEIMNAFIR